MRSRDFFVIIEQDEDGTFIASVPELIGCITQADTKEELDKNIKEVVKLCLDEDPEMFDENPLKSIMIEKIKVEI